MGFQRYGKIELRGIARVAAEGHIMAIERLMGVIKEVRVATFVQNCTLFEDVQNTELSQQKRNGRWLRSLGYAIVVLVTIIKEILVNGTRNNRSNIDGCNNNRHYLLHRPKILPPKKPDTSNKEQPDNTTKEDGPGANTEGDSQPKTYGATS